MNINDIDEISTDEYYKSDDIDNNNISDTSSTSGTTTNNYDDINKSNDDIDTFNDENIITNNDTNNDIINTSNNNINLTDNTNNSNTIDNMDIVDTNDVDTKINDAYLYACSRNDLRLIKIYLRNGADVNAVSKKLNGLFISLNKINENYDIYDIFFHLINNKINVNYIDHAGNNILHHFIKLNIKRHYRIVILLIESNIDINAQNNLGETAIIVAAKKKNRYIVDLIWTYSGSHLNLNLKDMYNKTAFDYAPFLNNYCLYRLNKQLNNITF